MPFGTLRISDFVVLLHSPVNDLHIAKLSQHHTARRGRLTPFRNFYKPLFEPADHLELFGRSNI